MSPSVGRMKFPSGNFIKNVNLCRFSHAATKKSIQPHPSWRLAITSSLAMAIELNGPRRHDVTTSMFDDRGNLTWEVFIMISEDLRTSIQWMQARNAPFFGALLALIFTRFRWMTLAAFSHLDYQSGGSKTGNIGNSNWEE